MGFINNTSSNSFTSAFTPSLNNVRGLNGPSNGRLGTPTPKFQAPNGTNNLSYSQPTAVSPAMKAFGSTQSVSGLMGPKLPAKPANSTVSPAMTAPGSTSLTTTPNSNLGTTNVAGSAVSPAAASVATGTALNSRGGLAKAGASKGTAEAPSTSFSGLVNTLAGKSNASAEQARIQKQLQQEAMNNKSIGQDARNIADQYSTQIANVGKLGAGAVAGDLSTGSSIVGSGNANLASQSASSRMQALSNAEQAALQGTGQQLQGQGQVQTGLNQALSSANTQQAQGISGISQAAGYAQPNPTAYGQAVFNPLTKQYEGGGFNMDPQTQASNLAQQVISGKMTMAQAQQALSYAGAAGNNFLANAITQAGGNPLQLEAQGNVQQQNLGTSGTAVTSANAGGLQQSIKQEVDLGTAASQAHDLAGQVQSSMQNSGLQLTNSTDMNTVINNLQSRLGNEAYTKLNIAVNDAKAAYAQILSTSGATPTEAGSMAEQNINANMSPSQILSAIDQLNQGVKARQDAAHTQTQLYQSMLGTSGGNTSTGGGGATNDWNSPLFN